MPRLQAAALLLPAPQTPNIAEKWALTIFRCAIGLVKTVRPGLGLAVFRHSCKRVVGIHDIHGIVRLAKPNSNEAR
jgi:hypothetical protein